MNDTEKATTIFDGITYSKGASTLKCLLSNVGEEKFGKAMENYFHKFQQSNTELADLLQCIQEQTDVDMSQWRDHWIQKAGYNYLLPSTLHFEDGRKSLLIKQGYVNNLHQTLRNHAIKIAFFDSNRKVVAVKPFTVPNKAETLLDISDVPEFEAVFLNYDDQDFVQTRLDTQSYNFFAQNISLFEDDLVRALSLRAFFDSLIFGETSTKDWNRIVCGFIEQEKKVPRKLTYLGATSAVCIRTGD